MIDPGFTPTPSKSYDVPKISAKEIKARNYTWVQNLEEAIKHCRENGHEGVAQTLEDIVKHFNSK